MAKPKFEKSAGLFGTVFSGKSKSGKDVVLEPPSTKSNRYYNESVNKKNFNTGKDLTDTQLAYRAGYVASQKDNANAYKSKSKK